MGNEPTRNQIKIIHVLKGRLGLDDAFYRDLLETRYQVDSSKKLKYRQANNFINFLISMMGYEKRTTTSVTYRQEEYIKKLVNQIEWRAADGYKLFLKKRFNMTRVKKSKDAQKVIEALKAMRERQIH